MRPVSRRGDRTTGQAPRPRRRRSHRRLARVDPPAHKVRPCLGRIPLDREVHLAPPDNGLEVFRVSQANASRDVGIFGHVDAHGPGRSGRSTSGRCAGRAWPEPEGLSAGTGTGRGQQRLLVETVSLRRAESPQRWPGGAERRGDIRRQRPHQQRETGEERAEPNGQLDKEDHGSLSRRQPVAAVHSS